MKRNPPLNTPHRKPRRVQNATDHPRLLLKRTRKRLENRRRIIKINYIDMPFSSSNNEELVFDIHRIDSFRTLQRRDGIRLSKVPVPDGLVP